MSEAAIGASVNSIHDRELPAREFGPAKGADGILGRTLVVEGPSECSTDAPTCTLSIAPRLPSGTVQTGIVRRARSDDGAAAVANDTAGRVETGSSLMNLAVSVLPTKLLVGVVV